MRALLMVGLIACSSRSEPVSESPPKRAWNVDVPQVKDVGVAPHDETDPAVIIQPTGLTFDGQPIVGLTGGAFDPADLENGGLGLKVTKLEKFTKAFLENATKSGKTDLRFSLMIDRSVAYKTLLSTMFSMRRAGVKRFAIVARVGDDAVAVPITAPDRAKAVGDPVRSPGADLAAQIEAVKAEGGKVRTGQGPRSPVTVTAKRTLQDTTLTVDAIAAKLASTYSTGIQRCAAKAPGAQKLKLSFHVTVEGRTDRPKATGTTAVAECVGALIAGWRFPIPKQKTDLTPTETSVELELEVEAPPTLATDTDATAFAQLLTEDSRDPRNDVGARDPGRPLDVMMDPDRQPLGLIVSVRKSEVALWSISRLEGTLHEPKRTWPRGPDTPRELGNALREIVQRRWGDAQRPPEHLEIIFQADSATPMQQVVELLFAMRMAPDKKVLFPNLMLSTGFE